MATGTMTNGLPKKARVHWTYTYLLTPWSTVLLEKLTGSQSVKKFPAFMEPEDSQVRATCLYPKPDQSSPCPHIPLPEEHLNPSIYAWFFQVVSFPQVSPLKSRIHLSSPHTCYMPFPSHSPRFGHPKNIGWGVQIIKLHIMYFSPLPVTSSLLGPNILLSAFDTLIYKFYIYVYTRTYTRTHNKSV
jgi:hypothetical protein